MSAHSVLDRPDRQESNPQPPQKPTLLNRTAAGPIPLRRKELFEDSLLEVSSEQRRRKTWATGFSVVVEILLASVVVIVPLWHTQVLPIQELTMMLTAPPPPPPAPPPPPPAAARLARVTANVVSGRLLAPTAIPSKILMVKEPEPPPPSGVIGGVPGGVPGGSPGGVLGGILGGILRSSSPPVAVRGPSNPTPKRIRVSQGVTEGMILTKVEPVYPAIAEAARIEGVVVLRAIIDEDGNIQNLEAVSGSPMLVPAAIDAVRQWKYRPYLLNGQPVEVETTVQVIFRIGQ